MLARASGYGTPEEGFAMSFLRRLWVGLVVVGVGVAGSWAIPACGGGADLNVPGDDGGATDVSTGGDVTASTDTGGGDTGGGTATDASDASSNTGPCREFEV